MPDYSKTVIYKIQHEDNEELVYVGSTTDFTKRKCNHKSISNNPNDKGHNFKLYKMINDNGGWSCFKMIQIKEFPCNNNREAEAEEDKVMLELKAIMNSIRASRSKKEYYENNRKQISQKEKLYREINKEIISQKEKQYRENNKEKIAQFQKQYYEKNKEQLIQQMKDYSEKNKEKILQKLTCDCGCIITRKTLERHKKSNKHTKLLNDTLKQ